ncbi:MAG: transposase [Bacteroidetes bacterium]|nr:transposase [Bacteroidota bacterium]MCB9227702.1 transposase [Chitinophagales bacterium]
MGLRNRANFNEFNIFFITTTCNKWLHLLSLGNSMRIVVESLSFCCNKYQASIMAYILMPNHIHLLIHFEDGKNRISFMRDFKKNYIYTN